MSERGQSLVELAISFVFMMLLLVGIAEFGIILFQYVQLRDAAQEGALYGSMYPADTLSIESRIRGASSKPIDLQNPEVEIFVSYPDGSLCEGNPIKVNVVYPHKVFMPLLPKIIGDTLMLNGEVTDTILNQDCNL